MGKTDPVTLFLLLVPIRTLEICTDSVVVVVWVATTPLSKTSQYRAVHVGTTLARHMLGVDLG